MCCESRKFVGSSWSIKCTEASDSVPRNRIREVSGSSAHGARVGLWRSPPRLVQLGGDASKECMDWGERVPQDRLVPRLELTIGGGVGGRLEGFGGS